MTKNKKTIVITIIIICALAIIVIASFFGIKSNKNAKRDDNRKLEELMTPDEIRERLGINMDIYATKSDTGYFIEDQDIARIEYTARKMKLVLKSSSDNRKNLVNLIHEWDFPIRMVTICEDGTNIEVTASVALDDDKIMKAEWYDNDLYYSMNTFELTSREDFLQEVNKIIIECHEEFE